MLIKAHKSEMLSYCFFAQNAILLSKLDGHYANKCTEKKEIQKLPPREGT